MPTAVDTSQGVISIIVQVAEAFGVDPRLAVATSQVETAGTFNPAIVGDHGTSFGLFQLHEGGELGNLTQAQASDPVTNATVAMGTIAAVQHAHPDWSPGQIAAAAQRPADPAGYANSVNAAYNALPATIPGLLKVPVPAIPSGMSGASSTNSSSTGSGLLHVDMGVVGNLLQMLAGGVLILVGTNMVIKDLTGASPFGAVERVARMGVSAVPGGAAVSAVGQRRTQRATRARTSEVREQELAARERAAQARTESAERRIARGRGSQGVSRPGPRARGFPDDSERDFGESAA